MAKKVQAQVKLQIAAGKATPAPPVGTALGPHGVNIMDFCKNFNAKTAGQEGLIIPVVVTIYADRSYSFITKTPPAPVLLKRAANIAKGSAEPNKAKVGTVTKKQVEEIARLKLPDLNTDNLESAIRSVVGHGARRWGWTSFSRARTLVRRHGKPCRPAGPLGLWEGASAPDSTTGGRDGRQEVQGRAGAGRPTGRTRSKRRFRSFRRSSSPSSTRPSSSRCGLASIPSTPIRWCAARSSCRMAWARPSACW